MAEPVVLLIGEPSGRVGKKLKRSYFTMRIPQSVAERVHARLSSTSRSRRAPDVRLIEVLHPRRIVLQHHRRVNVAEHPRDLFRSLPSL